MRSRRRLVGGTLRTALSIAALLAVAVGVSACGGTTVSESLPKSTPEITPPKNTGLERAAIRQASSSTTSTSQTASGEASSSSSAPTEPSESTAVTPEEEGLQETGGVAPVEEATAPPEEEATAPEEGPEEGEEEAAGGGTAGNTGGASAP